MSETRVDAEAVTRLRQVINKLARRLNTTSTEEGLSPSQASVLGLVTARGPLGIPALVEAEGLHPTMMSRVVSKLDESGFIQRVPDPADVRSASIQVTRKGAAAHARIKARRAAAVSQCVAKLPAEQAASILEALPGLEALAEELQRARR